MFAPKSHTTVVSPRSHALPPPSVTPADGSSIRNWRWLLAALSLIGLIASIAATLLALAHPEIFTRMPERVTQASLPGVCFTLLPAGYVMIVMAMVFLMRPPWFGYHLGMWGMQRRLRNWFLIAGSAVGIIAAAACTLTLTFRHVQSPSAMKLDNGHYRLIQNFQTVREISAEEATDVNNARLLFPVMIHYLNNAIFSLFSYLGALLYALWYLRTNPQIDVREGLLDGTGP